MGEPAGAGSGRRRWPRRVILTVLGLAGAALATTVMLNSTDELTAAADTLTTLNWWWVGVAVGAETVSYGVRGAAELVVLRRGQTVRSPRRPVASGSPHQAGEADGGRADPVGAGRPGAVVLASATLAGDAAAYCLPFGFAAAGVVTVRALARRGVPAALATWTFAVAQMFYVGSVAVLTLVAVEVAGDRDPVPGLSAASTALVVGLVVVALLVSAARRWEVVRVPLVRWRARRRVAARRASGAPGTGTRVAHRVGGWWRTQAEQLRSAQMTLAAAAVTFALMMISWLTDVAVLGIAYAALGSAPPWLGLLLAYCAGQIAAALPVTPGGIGAVEGSLTLALLAFGGLETTTLAAVLLYRLIAYWGCIPAGALAGVLLRVTAPRGTAVPARSTATREAEPA